MKSMIVIVVVFILQALGGFVTAVGVGRSAVWIIAMGMSIATVGFMLNLWHVTTLKTPEPPGAGAPIRPPNILK